MRNLFEFLSRFNKIGSGLSDSFNRKNQSMESDIVRGVQECMMLLYNVVRFFTLMKLILSNRLDSSRYTSTSLMFQHSTWLM